MAFDPDAYLAKQTTPTSSFDPDAYLAKPPSEASFGQKVMDAVSTPLPLLANKAYEGVQNVFAKGGEALTNAMTTGMTPNPALPGVPLSFSATPGSGITTDPTTAKVAGKVMKYTPDIVTAIIPIGPSSSLTKAGGQGLNKSIGLRERTLKILSKGENPATFGAKLGNKLDKDGAIGLSSEANFDNVMRLKDQFGRQVGKTIEAIKASGGQAVVDSKKVLTDIMEEVTKRTNATYSSTKQTAAPFKQAYAKLSELAAANGGKISFDDLTTVLRETGEALGNTAVGSTKEEAYTQLYAQLAKTRTEFVELVAKTAKKPALAKQLKEANKQFSLYATIFDDITSQAAKEGVGAMGSVAKMEITKPGSFIPQAGQVGLSRLASGLGGIVERSRGPIANNVLRLTNQPFTQERRK